LHPTGNASIMKTIFSLLLMSSLILLLSCETEPIQKESPKITLTKKSAEIIEADHAFGFELFREVCRESEEENIMISPMSVSYALGMTYNGAAGTTLDAFNEVLHFGGLTNQEVNESYKDLMHQLLNLSEEVEFALANSIWYKEGYPVLEEFIKTNEDYFLAAVKEADFSDPLTVDLINGWIEEQTNDKIKDMLDYIPGSAVMYLINAIYFNADWRYEFPKENTYLGDFKLENGSKSSVDYMVVEGDFLYSGNDDFAAVELPYSDSSFSMLVMLPKTGSNVSSLIEALDVASWDSWFEHSQRLGVQVILPKFKYEFKDLLNDPLKTLGLGVAFSENADFSRIVSTGGIHISRVIHQTFIDVQEEGTEAAAATIVEIKENSSTGGGPITFHADRPFLYLIKENSTGAIVFMGKVGRPEYE
jgi:serine protease inhibitor